MRKTEDFSISFEVSEYSKNDKNKSWRFVYDWLDSLIYAILLILLIFTFFFRVVGVNGDSMNPTLQSGDWLTVSAITNEVKAGDIVVITQPNSLNEPLIKRVIAKGGDTVNIDFIEGTVTVNGKILYEPYIAEKTEISGDYVYPLEIPEGYIFVMGDNRNNSLDSRFRTIGLIDERYVLGVAETRIYPFGDWKINNEK
ncbi:MAG: signal peptidase I [Clostridia bacterium]|nr:signal peptidase I [Clostridia bacterium]MBR5544667.1 signal peptidase I [Clostridia bacterium]